MSALGPSRRTPHTVTDDPPGRWDVDLTWAYIGPRLTKITLKGMEGRSKLYMEIHSATYDYCTGRHYEHWQNGRFFSPSGGSWLFGERLYLKLIDYIEDNLRNILQRLKVYDSEDSLVFFTREWDRFSSSSILISNVMVHLYRRFILRVIREGERGDFYDIQTLHIVQRDSILIPGVRRRIHFEVWKAAMTRPMDEIIRHPAIEQIINLSSILRPIASPLNLRLRRIVLLTRPVDRLRGIMKKAESSDGRAWLPLSHWALFVEDKPFTGTLHEIGVQKGAARPETRYYSKIDGWARQVIGNTLLSNNDIKEYVKTVALMMQHNYRPLSNNCQKFCMDLFHAIRIPRNENDALQGIENFPYEFSAKIRSRRCQEYERLTYARFTDSMGPVSSIPTPIETYAVLVLNTAPIIFVRLELSAWRLIYMMFLVGLYALYAKRSLPGLRLISRRKEDPFEVIYRELHLEGISARQKRSRKLGSSPSTVKESPIIKGRRKVKRPVVAVHKKGTLLK